MLNDFTLATEKPKALTWKLRLYSGVCTATRERVKLAGVSDITRTVRQCVTWEYITPSYINTGTTCHWWGLTVLDGLTGSVLTGGVQAPILAESKKRTFQGGRLIRCNITISNKDN